MHNLKPLEYSYYFNEKIYQKIQKNITMDEDFWDATCKNQIEKLNIDYDSIIPKQTIFEKTHTLNESYEDYDFLSNIMKKRKSKIGTDKILSKETIFRIFYNSLAIKGNVSTYAGWNTIYRRYPSGGGLYPVKIFFISWNIKNLPNGKYFYDINNNTINKLPDKISLSEIINLNKMNFLKSIEEIKNKSLCHVYLISNTKNMFQKYGLLTFKLSLIEAGHIVQNLSLQSTKFNYDSLPICALNNDKILKCFDVESKWSNCEYGFLIE